MNQTKVDSSEMVFDHHTIRRFIGLIAIFLPLVVIVAGWGFPNSISASYHTPTEFPFLPYFPSPRDIFVGSLFVIGAFLMSYKGHRYKLTSGQVEKFFHKLGPKAVEFRIWEREREEDIVSWIAGSAAWIVALFPTEAGHECIQILLFGMQPDSSAFSKHITTIHLVFAAILFLSTVYFCLVAFKSRLNEKIETRGETRIWYTDALKWRRFIYNLSGWSSLLLIIALAALGLFLKGNVCIIPDQTYWAETIMLGLIGIAWFTASKPLFLRDASEKSPAGSTSSE